MNLFKSLIKCTQCNKNYKYKRERGKSVYICSGYANYGKDFCTRRKIDEEHLVIVLKTGFVNNDIEWTRDNDYISTHVKEIQVDKNGDIEIVFYRHESTFWNSNRLGQL